VKKTLLIGLVFLGLLSIGNLGFAAVAAYNPDYTYGTTVVKPQQQVYQPQAYVQPFTPSAIFSGMGPYAGVQGGISGVMGPERDDYYNYFFLWEGNYSSTPAWRGFVGFNIIKFFAVEGGFSQYTSVDYPCTSYSNCSVHGTQAWDIMAKFILPIRTPNPNVNVEAYLKAGAAYVTSQLDVDFPNREYSTSGWTPAYGLGVTVYFYRFVGLDLSCYSFYGQDGYIDRYGQLHGDYLPRTSLFSLGLIFKLPLQ
jgi:hypothetical protein